MSLLKNQYKQLTIKVKEIISIFSFIWNHPSNKGRKIQQILIAIKFQRLTRVAHYRPQAKVGSNAKIWVDLHRTAASKALYANPPDWPEMGVWQKILERGDLFIDVGANIGTYNVLSASLGAQVIAIEQADDTFELLKENIELNNFKNVTLVKAVAVDHEGEVNFTEGLDSVNHIDPESPKTVTGITLDSLIGSSTVKGIKIDVEGFELKVLQGATKALGDKRIGLIQLEWNDASMSAVGTDRVPVKNFLKTYGYEIYRADTSVNLYLDVNPLGIRDVFAAPIVKST
jgi:FkbM family methyltransferase